MGIVLLALRPIWKIPLQADDGIILILLGRDDRASVTKVAYDYMVHNVVYNPGHFNPIGYFFDGLLKGGMLATKSPVFTATVLQYMVITAMALITLVLAAKLLSLLLQIFSDATTPATRLAIPISVGFAATAQLTARWNWYDPLVVQAVFAAVPTALGFAYLLLSLKALSSERWYRWAAWGALTGVIGLLVYEVVVVFVGALVVLALLGHRRGLRGLRVRLPWLLLPPLATLVISWTVMSRHPASGYGGTAFTVGFSLPSTWASTTNTSLPGSLWGMSAQALGSEHVVRVALLSAALVAVLSWFWLRRAPLSVPSAEPHTAGESPSARPSLFVLVPILVLALLAPAPYLFSTQWSAYLLTHGNNYNHSLIVLWCWAMIFAVFAWRLAQMRIGGVLRAGVALGLFLWVAQQFSINYQLADQLDVRPMYGLDVTGVLESPNIASEEERCTSVEFFLKLPAGEGVDWLSVYNREFAERHGGQEYCEEPLPVAD